MTLHDPHRYDKTVTQEKKSAMPQQHYSKQVYLSFALVIVGYMTLTLTLPLMGQIVAQSNISRMNLNHCLSLLFFGFALSAIVLSRLADLHSPIHILKYAQITSVAGLITICFAMHTTTFYIGFILIGGSTGCYSSIARMIIADASQTDLHIRKNFSIYSILTIIAPFMSTLIALIGLHSHWQVSYILMSIIEATLYLFVISILSEYKPQKDSASQPDFFSGYTYCLKKPYYVAQMICTGIGAASFIQSSWAIRTRFSSHNSINPAPFMRH